MEKIPDTHLFLLPPTTARCPPAAAPGRCFGSLQQQLRGVALAAVRDSPESYGGSLLEFMNSDQVPVNRGSPAWPDPDPVIRTCVVRTTDPVSWP